MLKKYLLVAYLVIAHGLLAHLFIIFGIDKRNDYFGFIQNIASYELFSYQFTRTIAFILPYIEIVIGSFLIIACLSIVLRLNQYLSFKAYHWLRSCLLINYIALLIALLSFCLILVRGYHLGLTDCGCGNAWDPLDAYSKSLWMLLSGEGMSSIESSIFRNIISLLIGLSLINYFYKEFKHEQ